jgi:hypothetical protein
MWGGEVRPAMRLKHPYVDETGGYREVPRDTRAEPLVENAGRVRDAGQVSAAYHDLFHRQKGGYEPGMCFGLREGPRP